MARRPKFKHVMSVIERRIRKGDYVLTPIPGERKIAEETGVSHMTARKAVRGLLERKVLIRRPNGSLDISPRFQGGAGAAHFLLLYPAYASTYLTPIFLGRVRGYSSLEIGTTVFIAGIFMTFSAPLAARLTTIIDQRIVMAVGFLLFALASWMMSGIASNWGFWELFVPQAVRGFALLLCIVPSVGLALNGVPPEELRYASGLFNLMRNLGGAIGIAAVTTWLQDFGRLHGERFGEALANANTSALAEASARMVSITSDPAHAQQFLQGELAQFVTGQALTQAFSDVFYLIAALFTVALLIVPFCKGALFSDTAPVEAH